MKGSERKTVYIAAIAKLDSRLEHSEVRDPWNINAFQVLTLFQIT